MSNLASHYQSLLATFPQLCQVWDQSVIPELKAFIEIPNQSPEFDPDWEAHGYMQEAAQRLLQWCQKQPIRNMSVELLQTPGRTPLFFIEVPPYHDTSAAPMNTDTNAVILLYGHFDKQPPMTGWRAHLGPWQPVIEDGKLYGRGAADDGYSVFTALTAIAWLQQLNIPHARCVILIEGSEESGSIDLPHYLQELYPRIGTPSLVVGLDSGCGNYEQLWITTSLRGMISGILDIRVLAHGIHSGYGSGAVPSAVTILRLLLDRLEDAHTGSIRLPELHQPIPQAQQHYAHQLAQTLGQRIVTDFPLLESTEPTTHDLTELLLRRNWHPALTVTGISGLPRTAHAGNVLVPKLRVKLSMRISPICEPQSALQAMTTALETDPPYGAQVRFIPEDATAGWLAPPVADWLATASTQASELFFKKPALHLGEGGSIPFMGMLAAKFNQAQFLITGVLGPHSNAHGPNEFLHLDMAKKLTGCIAAMIAAHHQHHQTE